MEAEILGPSPESPISKSMASTQTNDRNPNPDPSSLQPQGDRDFERDLLVGIVWRLLSEADHPVYRHRDEGTIWSLSSAHPRHRLRNWRGD